MTDLSAAVRQALSTVIDPDLKKDLVTLNMIRELSIDADGVAAFTLVLTTAACPVKDELEQQCRDAAQSVDGITGVKLTTTSEPRQIPQLADILPGVGQVIAVASGKGGVGKSTVTANLACALAARGARVGLMDADIYGPSTPKMMGIQQEPFVSDKKIVPVVNHGVRMISMGFLVEEEAAMVWRGPMLQGAIRQFVTDVKWGQLDYLLVDLPPGTGDVQMTLSQTVPISGAVVVTTPQTIALLDARRGVTMFNKLNVPVLGLVENMSQYICPACGHTEAIFGVDGGKTYAEEIDIPFLGAIPIEPGIRQAGDEGTPIVVAEPDSRSGAAFAELANNVVRQAAINAANATRQPAPTPAE
jgi:ATP-binding protein involved in chromosome partitioning